MALRERDGDVETSPWKRWLWFGGLWIAGVLAVATVSLLLRWILQP